MPENIFITVVIPVYNEAENVPILHEELTATLSTMGKPFELIFIDDGSADGTPESLEALRGENVVAERFGNNRGKSAALTRGFSLARGEVVITMDGDLQDDPKEIPRFIEALDNYDMVSGWRRERRDPLSKTLPSRAYNSLTRLLTGIRLHDLNCGYKAYRRDAVKGLALSGGMHRYIAVILQMKGCRIGEVEVRHRPRVHGKSKYGPVRLLAGLAGLIRIRFFGR